MQNAISHKAKELKPEVRAAIESEFGRPLQDDEGISIVAYPPYLPHDSPEDKERQNGAAKLRAVFSQFDQENTASPEETEEIVFEALRHRKPGYREREWGSSSIQMCWLEAIRAPAGRRDARYYARSNPHIS